MKGAAFREFLPTLRFEYCVILESDATYPPAFIPLFAETLRQGAPVVLGSRLKEKIEDRAMSAANQLGNRSLSLLASLLHHRRVSDVCSGMWAFRTEVLQSLRITADGFDVEANLFAKCVRRGSPHRRGSDPILPPDWYGEAPHPDGPADRVGPPREPAPQPSPGRPRAPVGVALPRAIRSPGVGDAAP